MLYHSRIVDYDNDNEPISDIKVVGCYSSMAKVRDTVERFKKLPGFCLYPKNFIIERKRIYYKSNLEIEDNIIAYQLIHEYDDIPANNCDVVTRLKIFAEKDLAIKEIETLKKKNAFLPHPNGFIIDEYNINKDSLYWGEGFD